MSRGLRLLLWVGVLLYKLLGLTWRWQITDEAGVLRPGERSGRVIWLFWHNRLLAVPVLWRRFFRHRPGAVLVSRSRDGEMLSYVVEKMGGFPVRGSSSRGGGAALAELTRALGKGLDPYITPDGPRGPCYSIQPGAVWLAQATGTPVMPVHIEVSRCWRLGSWDRFMIPKPFARLTVTMGVPLTVSPVEGEEAMAQERERLRQLMLAHTQTQ